MSDPDEERASRDRELVAAALDGDAAARAVLAERMRCLPLEVARRDGDPGSFPSEVRAQLSMALEALHLYDGTPALEVWLADRVQRSLPLATPAADPEALADTIDLGAALERQLGRPKRARRSPQRHLAKTLPVVGVALLLALFLWEDPDFGPSSAVDDVRGGEVLLNGPTGETAAWGAFSWSAEPVPGYFARVVVSGSDGAVLRSPRLEETTWVPSPEQRDRLPDRIRWEVIEGDGRRRGWARAWLQAR